MSNLSYYSRLKELNLESLELRRLRTDLLTVYKILFGLLNDKQRCTDSVRKTFFNRVVNMWNNLPGDTTDFSSFQRLRKSLSNDYLTQLNKVNFN